MRILVISDSHGNYPQALRAHELAGPVDHIVHLGDGAEDAALMEEILGVPVLRVAGNCDFGSGLPSELSLQLGGLTVLATHGNRYRVKSGLALLQRRGRELGARLVLYGHTHLPAIDTCDGMLLVNPGELKTEGAGSFALVTVTGGEAQAQIVSVDGEP